MVIKCKMCSRENTIDIIEDSVASYTEDDVGQFKSIVTFDCRGIEPIDFDPREGFVVKAIDGGIIIFCCGYSQKAQRNML